MELAVGCSQIFSDSSEIGVKRAEIKTVSLLHIHHVRTYVPRIWFTKTTKNMKSRLGFCLKQREVCIFQIKGGGQTELVVFEPVRRLSLSAIATATSITFSRF